MQQKVLLKRQLIEKILAFWQRRGLGSYLLLPFSYLFQLITYIRYRWYVLGHNQQHFSIPIIVVGNISLGGTGKTPFVAWLAHFLQKEGFVPGIVMRGYGGQLKIGQVAQVDANSAAQEVGDEPLLLANKCSCPVFVGKKRPQAVEQLLKRYPDTTVIICDDGLQHYALGRDIEIAIIDGNKRLGNGFCLPAGPLRESPDRLLQVDFVITNGIANTGEWLMRTALSQVVYAISTGQPCLLDDFIGKTVYAVAGIGAPERFFAMLEEKGINFINCAFPDHHCFLPRDFEELTHFPILMTEKDAVKCQQIVPKNSWYVPLVVTLPSEFEASLLAKVKHG